MADLVELGAEGVNKLTDKYFDTAYDKVNTRIENRKTKKHPERAQQQQQQANNTTTTTTQERVVYAENTAPSAVASGTGRARKQKNQLPSPEGERRSSQQTTYRDTNYKPHPSRRESSLDRQSEQSEQVIRAYELERDDPRVHPATVLPKRDLNKLNRNRNMSRAGGYAPSNGGRAKSEGGRGRYYDDDDDSDYDERSGRRQRNTGRGYDDRDYDDDRQYDREIITTEKYRGPPREQNGYSQSRGYGDAAAGAAAGGAVTQYNRRSDYDDDYQSRRSGSRGRMTRYRSRSRSDSRSRSRSGSRDRGVSEKVGEYFDTTQKGLLYGAAGAVVGGLAGRQVSSRNPRHKNRDILIGAVVGGLVANAAEHKYNEWSQEKEEKEARYGSRSRSAMR